MSTVVTRAVKGSPLTYAEMDANFNNLNTDKLEAGTPGTNIANTPAGTIAAVTVQAAINELDTDKLATTATALNGTTIPASKTLVVTTDIGSTVQAYVAPNTSGNVLTSNGSAWTSAALPDVTEPYVLIQEQAASGTNGGTFTSGAWQKRLLNTEVYDASTLSTLASNQVTLLAGTYRFRGWAQSYYVNLNKLRLQNITDATTVVYGSGGYAAAAVGGNVDFAEVSGRFTITASKAFELQHQCQTTQVVNGFGVASTFGTEIYSQLEFWKEI